MEYFKFLLTNKRECRRRRRDLIEFLDALSLYLRVGWDLGHAWRETLATLDSHFASDLSSWLCHAEDSRENLMRIWQHLSQNYPDTSHRVWFSAIENLYRNGAGMGEVIQAISSTLRKEQERDLENHCRLLPTKVNVCLILFFLPPTLVWLFAPLVLEIGAVLSQ
jgi:hypothetical protein